MRPLSPTAQPWPGSAKSTSSKLSSPELKLSSQRAPSTVCSRALSLDPPASRASRAVPQYPPIAQPSVGPTRSTLPSRSGRVLWPVQVSPSSVLVAVMSPTAHSVPTLFVAIPPRLAEPVKFCCHVAPASSLTRIWLTSPMAQSSVGPTA